MVLCSTIFEDPHQHRCQRGIPVQKADELRHVLGLLLRRLGPELLLPLPHIGIRIEGSLEPLGVDSAVFVEDMG